MWGISLTHPVLPSFLSGEFLLQIPCWLVLFLLFLLIIILGVSLTHPVLVYYFWGGISLTHPMVGSFFSGEFLLHIPCWLLSSGEFLLHIPFYLHFYPGGFFCSFFFFKSGEFLLHIPCWFIFYWGSFSYISRFLVVCFSFFVLFLFLLLSLSLYLGSFSYTSRAGFIFIWGVSLTHPMLDLLF